MAQMETNGQNPERSALGDFFDRAKRSLDGVPDVVQVKPATVDAKTLLETTQMYTVQTFRKREVKQTAFGESPKYGKPEFTVFLQYIDRDGGQRMVIPPEVTDMIARQRKALTVKVRKAAARANAADRKARGIKPDFTKKKDKLGA